MQKKNLKNNSEVIQEDVLNALTEIKHQLKLMDEKSRHFEGKISTDLILKSHEIKRDLERTLTAEFLVAIKDSEERLKIFLTKSNDVMFTRIDPLLSELENSRLDRELSAEKSTELEKRIEKLEKAVN